jgi:hypothetical protein
MPGSKHFYAGIPDAGVAVVVSDFLTPGDLQRAFNMLHGAGLEIFAAQILAPSELAPELAGDLRFVDSETHANARHQFRGGSARALP